MTSTTLWKEVCDEGLARAVAGCAADVAGGCFGLRLRHKTGLSTRSIWGPESVHNNNYASHILLWMWGNPWSMGPRWIYESKDISLYMGNQMVIFRNVPIGRYVATLSYSGMVVTKCALICGNDEAAWRQQCMNNLKDMLTAKRGKGAWGPRSGEDFDCGTSGAGKCTEPCPCCICFTMPDDVLKYDPWWWRI